MYPLFAVIFEGGQNGFANFFAFAKIFAKTFVLV